VATIDPLTPGGGTFELELDGPVAEGPRRWLEERVAAGALAPGPPEARRRLHARLVAAEVLETFLGARFVAAKRFSLEGLDALLPLLEAIVDDSAAAGVREVVVGTAHRGRLGLLVGLGARSREEVLAMFARAPGGELEDGDVRYHLGGSATRAGATITIVPNPSHVEWVNPVVTGWARARQAAAGGVGAVLPVLIHGDGAFAGQGVAAETLNLARLAGYAVGGTVHVVANNQVAFTAEPADSRSSRHASDVARMLRVPVLRVSADDPDTVVAVGRLAAAYRAVHRDDIVIDLVGYRRRGHNEADEPRFTQPVAYRAIDAHPTVRALHARRLADDGVLGEPDAGRLVADETAAWRRTLAAVRAGGAARSEEAVAGDVPVEAPPPPPSLDGLAAAARALAAVPAGVDLPAKVAALLAARARAVAAGDRVDVAAAEMLAWATLVADGVSVRLSGQDARRGTFSQRHAAVRDQATGAVHVPLADLGPGRFEVHDGPLSEAAVLGFEYGRSVAAPAALTIWEAQYGDFANAAQVVIDTFVAAGEARWGLRSGLVLLLPHGHEGQGPEHSSARVERFLALCADDNLRVCQPTTAAQLFHLLRSQVGRRRPLVVLTGKGLLRAAHAASPVADLTTGGFAPVLVDGDVAAARRVVLCSGRLYHDLAAARAAGDPVALVRLEQLYPLSDEVRALLAGRSPRAPIVWAQEEPRNLGAWRYLADVLRDVPLTCVARPASASPAGGSMARHQREQADVVARALGA